MVTKVPRFTFEKFAGAEDKLTSQMKSVGEAMAIGRTFKESLQKALRSLEIGSAGFEPRASASAAELDAKLSRAELRAPLVRRRGVSARLHASSACSSSRRSIRGSSRTSARSSRWKASSSACRGEVRSGTRQARRPTTLRRAKRWASPTSAYRRCSAPSEKAVRDRRRADGIMPVYKTVDTCAAEFEAYTPYLYSTYETEDEAKPHRRARRSSFSAAAPTASARASSSTTAACTRSFALKDAGYETIMVNCNPETVSTDYDTSDRLYFEPLTLEDVLEIVAHREALRRDRAVRRPDAAQARQARSRPRACRSSARRPTRSTAPRTASASGTCSTSSSFSQPPSATARTRGGRRMTIASASGFRCWCARPTCSAGARWRSCTRWTHLRRYMERAIESSPEHPVLIDKFLDDAIEVDVDAVSRRQARGDRRHHGAHRDGRRALRRQRVLASAVVAARERCSSEIRRQTVALALELGVCGLMNVQFAVDGDIVYVLEVNPRASRTVPFVSKAIGVPLAKLAARVMAGETLDQLGFTAGSRSRATRRSRKRCSRSSSSRASTRCSVPR